MRQATLLRLDSPWEDQARITLFFLLMLGLGLVLVAWPAHAADGQGPWECSSYTDEAHTRCLEAFVQAQRDQIATLQGQVQAQQDTVNQLKNQMDRQAAASANAQQQLAQPPTIVQTVPPLYYYPPVGLGLYFGRPYFYGPPYFYRPYFYGPRFGYGHRGRRW